MRRFVGLLLVACVAVGACSSGGSKPSAAGNSNGASQPAGSSASSGGNGGGNGGDGQFACGSGTYKTFSTQTFCGTAKGTVKLGSESYTIGRGMCIEDPTVGWVMNLGTIVIGGKDLPKDAPNYFAVTYKDGQGMATGILGGLNFAVTKAQVELSADKSSGTAKGTDLEDRPLEATFSCK